MRQFDVYRNPSERSGGHAPYFVVLQSHHLEELDSVVVAPVLRDAQRSMSSLDIPVELGGERLVVALGELFAIERPLLRGPAGSFGGMEDVLRRGLDRLFTGF